MKKIMATVSQSLKKAGSENLVAKVIDEAMDYMIPFI